MKRKIIATLAAVMLIGGLASCSTKADVASSNLSKQADNFQILRRIVFFNGITDTYLLEITGYCSLGNNDPSYRLSVTCKVDGGYRKHFLGLSDNVSYFVQQIDASEVSTTRYTVIFRPTTIVPSIQSP